MSKLLPIFFLLLMASCSHKQFPERSSQLDSQWDRSDMWYQNDKKIDKNLVDVFYITSTVAGKAVDANGKEMVRATLNDNDRAVFKKEMSYANFMFGDSVNFYSPYYHQFTLSSIITPIEHKADSMVAVAKEVCDVFDYYMKHYNNGRRFIIAGFSQGAVHTLTLLKHMNDNQYKRLVAAYMLGYRLSEGDMQHPHVKPAMSATDKGVTISFNSVTSPDGIWHAITDGAATCINPISWTTDSTPAALIYKGDTATVSVDKTYNVLIVDGLDMSKYYTPGQETYFPKGNLHRWDIKFYRDAIRQNAMLRAYGKHED
ncbi:MAG: DUF3089 domain-containing protein [Prevotellaceae bacterium]|nr:DUF3089 domain-containing protein [Prevotellaceae bacterium]